MPQLPRTETETMRASVDTMRRQLEHDDMRYVRPALRLLLGLIVIMCERLLPVIEQVNDLEKRMDELGGRYRGHSGSGEDEED